MIHFRAGIKQNTRTHRQNKTHTTFFYRVVVVVTHTHTHKRAHSLTDRVCWWDGLSKPNWCVTRDAWLVTFAPVAQFAVDGSDALQSSVLVVRTPASWCALFNWYSFEFAARTLDRFVHNYCALCTHTHTHANRKYKPIPRYTSRYAMNANGNIARIGSAVNMLTEFIGFIQGSHMNVCFSRMTHSFTLDVATVPKFSPKLAHGSVTAPWIQTRQKMQYHFI